MPGGGGAPLDFKNNHRLFCFSFYIAFVISLWFLDGIGLPIHVSSLSFFLEILLSFIVSSIVSFSIKFVVERFVQKLKDSIFLQK